MIAGTPEFELTNVLRMDVSIRTRVIAVIWSLIIAGLFLEIHFDRTSPKER